MVVNLCLPQFNTSVHCDKVCADGYDVTNLVSADPALRRRGFKLEYFLRPPVQVTLKFGFQVELCRVDVELWPWCMDQGHACKRLEISTSSDRAQVHKEFQQKEQMKIQTKGQNVQNRETQQQHGSKSRCSNGQQWSLQAQQWGEEALTDPQQTGHAFKSPSKAESKRPDTEFKLVGRCELREETRVCFTRSNFSPRAPFHSPPPPQPANCRQEELWSRGLLSLGAVTQLRVMMPYGGAASALGIKTLAVWGQPARCCSAEEVQRIKRIHEARKRNLLRPGPFVPSVSQAKPSLEETIPPSNESIPEEFLDPITQEVMMLPMLLPCGMSVDNSTLEEHQKREATWGRAPNDPFTGVPFTSTSQPLPNPRLKHRIDRFLLQKGILGRDGMLGRQGGGENPQASRLIITEVDGKTVKSYNNSLLERGNKQHLNEDSTEMSTAKNELLPQTKRQRTDALPSCSSHEQRLSASLDEALFSALQGRPSFTSNLSLQRQFATDSEPVDTLEDCQTSNTPTLAAGEERCCACSCSVSIYSKSVSSIYHLACGHLLCRACLQKESQPINSASISTSNHILCPACQRPTPRSHVLRVHR